MPDLEYKITVKDDGSAVVDGFEKKTEDSMDDSADATAKASKRMRRSFKAVGAAAGRVKNSFGGVVKSATSLKKLFLTGLGAAIVLKGFRSITAAAAQQEDAVARLNAALQTAGVFSEEVSKQAQELATSLQAQTRFGDETILSMQALLVTYGVTPDKLAEATRASLDFAAATGRDLNTAALTVGKAAAGFTAELSRYGIIVDTKGIPASEVFTKVLAKLNQQFGGRAQADVNTWSGLMAQTRNVFGDFLEVLGAGVTKSERMREAIGGMSIGFRALTLALDTKGVEKYGNTLALLVPTAAGIVSAFGAAASSIDRMQIGLGALAKGALTLPAGLGALADSLGITEGAVDDVAESWKDVTRWQEIQVSQLQDTREAMDRARAFIKEMRKEQEKLAASTRASAAATKKQTEAIEGNIIAMIEAQGATKVMDQAVQGLIERRFEEIGLEKDIEFARITASSRMATAFREATLTFEGLSVRQKEAIAAAIAAVDPAKIQERGEAFIEAVRNLTDQSAALSAELRMSAGEAAETFFAGLGAQSFEELNSFVETQRARIDLARKFGKEEEGIKAATMQGLVFATGTGLAAIDKIATAFGNKSILESKAFAVVQVVISTAQAIARSFAELGPIAGIPAAVAMAAMGAAQIAVILAAKKGGGAGGGVSAAGGAAGAPAGAGAPALPAPVPEAAPVAAGPQVSITVRGFIGDEAELATKLDGLMREARGDGLEFGMGT